MKTGILAITTGGRRLAEKIAAELEDCRILYSERGVAATVNKSWSKLDAFVCIMASGIAVRAIAPLLKDKHSDPAVIVLDEKGKHVISLLSGHLGGGNTLARKISAITGGTAVITTASDTLGLVSLDLWAARQKLRCSEAKTFTRASSLLVNKGFLTIYSEVEVRKLPQGLRLTDKSDEADLVISHRLIPEAPLALHPSNLVIGIGCNRGTPLEEFEEAFTELFTEFGFSSLAVRNLASIDVKNDEEGLLLFAEKNGWPLHFFNREVINAVSGVEVSDAAMKAVGAIGVAEPASLLSAQSTTLLSRKRKWQNITMAVAQAPFTLSEQVLDLLNT